MLSYAVIALLSLTAQTDCVTAGSVPEDVPTFEVTFGDGSSGHVGIQINGEWVEDRYADIPGYQRLDLYFDTPWAEREPSGVRRSSLEQIRFEPIALRESRLKRGWAESGYILIETAAGCQALPEVELELAERARAMVDAQLRAPESEVADEPPPTPKIGWRDFLPHAAVILVGLAAAGVFLRMLVLA